MGRTYLGRERVDDLTRQRLSELQEEYDGELAEVEWCALGGADLQQGSLLVDGGRGHGVREWS